MDCSSNAWPWLRRSSSVEGIAREASFPLAVFIFSFDLLMITASNSSLRAWNCRSSF